jgi:hypothetical protein
MRTRNGSWRASLRWLAVGGWLLVGVAPSIARAQDEGEGAGDQELPPGHPSMGGGASPHGGGGGAAGGGMPGMFNPPEDTEQPDPLVPPGTIVVELRDADDKPVPDQPVTLGMIIQSIAKGDSRKHDQGTTDASGRAVFRNLDMASAVAYRVSTEYQGGAFAATPFQLQQAKTMHVVLHVYAVTHDVQQAVIVEQAVLAAEVRDDRLQIEQVIDVFNVGKVAWVPLDVDMKLPPGATAFSSQANMSNQGVDEIEGVARLRGTFAPGRHSIDFRWQLPWSGEKDVDFKVGLPPHVAIARVMLPAGTDIKLAVQGFPNAEVRHDGQGQSFLVTEKRVRPDQPRMEELEVGIHDLPSPGPGRWIAAVITATGVGIGLLLAAQRPTKKNERKPDRSARAKVLEELAELERGRASGEIGPKTYERAYRDLIDALARTLVKS